MFSVIILCVGDSYEVQLVRVEKVIAIYSFEDYIAACQAMSRLNNIINPKLEEIKYVG